MKLIKSVPLTQNSSIIQLPAGKYRGFWLNYNGTNQTSQTLAATDLGTVALKIKGRQVQLIEISRLQFINNLKHGAVAASSTISAAFNFSAFLPMFVPGDSSNVLFVESDAEAVLELNGFYSAGVTVIASGNASVYGIPAEGIQRYFLNIMQQDFNTVLGNGSQALPGLENFFELFILYSANLASLSVLVDGQARLSDAALQLMIDQTNLINAIETYTATPTYLDIPLSNTGDLTEALGDTCVLNYRVTSAAISPLKVVVFSVDWDPAKQKASSLVLQSNVGAKLDQKLRMNKTRVVQSLAL